MLSLFGFIYHFYTCSFLFSPVWEVLTYSGDLDHHFTKLLCIPCRFADTRPTSLSIFANFAHEVICADLSLNNVTDAEAFPGLIRQTHRKIRVASADGVYDTKQCHDELRRKKIRALIPPRTRASYWPAEYVDRNQAMARQRLTGSNAWWKWNTAYNQRSVAETAMYRVKQLFGGHLTLRDYDAQVG